MRLAPHNLNFIKVLLPILCVVFLSSCSKESPPDDYIDTPPNPDLLLEIPSNFPPLTYEIDQNTPTEKGFELGKKLFYDGRLASDGVVSCGFCHIQSFGFTHHTHIVSHGVDGALGTRNAQPLFNLAFLEDFTWDGAAEHLDLQPIIPISSEVEMNSSFQEIISKIQADSTYVSLFEEAFPNGAVNSGNILKALSQFMIMMVSANSKYDFVIRQEGAVLSDSEAAGLAVFDQKCASCHAGILFTDQSYRNNGLPLDPKYNDRGRKRVTGLDEDDRKFRVPTLRNIQNTFPYMHDGRFRTLEDVLDFYASGMEDSPTLDPQFRNTDGSLGIPLSSTEKNDLINFLKTLTDNTFLMDDRFSEF